MAEVYIGKPLFINIFTTCCMVPILDDEDFCPICGDEVINVEGESRRHTACRKYMEEKYDVKKGGVK